MTAGLRPRRYHAPEVEQLYGWLVSSHYDGQPSGWDPFLFVMHAEAALGKPLASLSAQGQRREAARQVAVDAAIREAKQQDEERQVQLQAIQRLQDQALRARAREDRKHREHARRTNQSRIMDDWAAFCERHPPE